MSILRAKDVGKVGKNLGSIYHSKSDYLHLGVLLRLDRYIFLVLHLLRDESHNKRGDSLNMIKEKRIYRYVLQVLNNQPLSWWIYLDLQVIKKIRGGQIKRGLKRMALKRNELNWNKRTIPINSTRLFSVQMYLNVKQFFEI